MNLFISKIHEILDKIRTFAIRYIVKLECSGEHIDNRKPKEDTEMKEYKLEQFLQDPEADLGTGLLATRGFGFCFTLKQPPPLGQDRRGYLDPAFWRDWRKTGTERIAGCFVAPGGD